MRWTRLAALFVRAHVMAMKGSAVRTPDMRVFGLPHLESEAVHERIAALLTQASGEHVPMSIGVGRRLGSGGRYGGSPGQSGGSAITGPASAERPGIDLDAGPFCYFWRCSATTNNDDQRQDHTS
ncbi:hypothetical protein Acor_78520 [Acrocarpospora corrugata]|uniref:Uncharacterized protein n=1 Tax=Acrocarpospora corrugata TaxID=35763 RepID=A0A5M3WF71_9ACTN|nr:hypothetical protein Acor_78520 [Acrocarpospora corrugata]